MHFDNFVWPQVLSPKPMGGKSQPFPTCEDSIGMSCNCAQSGQEMGLQDCDLYSLQSCVSLL